MGTDYWFVKFQIDTSDRSPRQLEGRILAADDEWIDRYRATLVHTNPTRGRLFSNVLRVCLLRWWSLTLLSSRPDLRSLDRAAMEKTRKPGGGWLKRTSYLTTTSRRKRFNGAPGSNTMSRVSVLDYLSSGTCAQRPIEGLTNILS